MRRREHPAATAAGTTRDEIKGRDLGDLVPEASVRRLVHHLAHVVREGRSVVFDEQTGGGFLEWALHPVADDLGRVARVAVFRRDVTARQTAAAALASSREELRRLARAREEAVEAERARIAREVHDDLGQSLTVLGIELAWLGGRLRSKAARERAAEARRLVAEVTDRVRRIASELRPPLLDSGGLAAAVDWHAHDICRRVGLDCAVDVAALESSTATTGAEARTALYRAIQEALTNVARHAGARRVEIRARRDRGSLVLEVADDGRGFDPAAPTRGLGLVGMRERVGHLGGRLEIGSSPAGTLLRIVLVDP